MNASESLHGNWHPSKDIFLAEITAVATKVTDASGTFVAHAWREQEAHTNLRGYRDKPGGRVGSVTINPGFSPEGDAFGVGDLVYMRHRGWTNVSGVGDTTYEIIGAAGVNPAGCCPGYLGDDGHDCCDILGGPPPCCDCDCDGGGGGGGTQAFCVIMCGGPYPGMIFYVTQADSPEAWAWFNERPTLKKECFGTQNFYSTYGLGHPSGYTWAENAPGFPTGVCPPTTGGGPRPSGDSTISGGGTGGISFGGAGWRPGPCSTSPHGHMLADGTWVPPCTTSGSGTGGGTILPRSPALGAGLLGGEILGGGLPVAAEVAAASTPSFGTVSPAQLTASVNNYAPGSAGLLLLTTDGSGPYNVTGLSMSQVDGQEVVIINDHAIDSIVFKMASGSSTAANRFSNGSDVGDITLAPGGRSWWKYTSATTSWRYLGNLS